MTKEVFLEIQLRRSRHTAPSVLRQPAGVDPEYIARANDPVAFAQFALGSYVPMGLLDSADVPAVGLETIATAVTGHGATPSRFRREVHAELRVVPGRETLDACEAFFDFIGCAAAITRLLHRYPVHALRTSRRPLRRAGVSTSLPEIADSGPLNIVGCIGALALRHHLFAKEIICDESGWLLDPNDITGPDGTGDERWVARQQTLPYTIRFENDSTKAIAPARRVTITQQLDTTADLRSLRLGSFGFGNRTCSRPRTTSRRTTTGST